MPATFPLFRLPIDECLAVLQQMEMSQLFTLSLISKRAKNLVTSADRRARYVLVSVNQKIRFKCLMLDGPDVRILNLELSIWKRPNERRKVKKPRYVTILKDSPIDTLIKCTKKEYKAKDWLEHLCQIFHRRDHSLLVEQNGYRYDLNSVYENFKKPSFFGLSAFGNTGYSNRVLKMIIPTSSISLVFPIFDNGQAPKNILIQNYYLFHCYGNDHLMNRTFPLDDLLCINSREIITHSLGFSEKDINKFLKLWIHGSNPRLRKLLIWNVSLDYDNVLRGIQNCILREDQEKVFKTVTESFAVRGGREIRRMNGTVGRIVIDNNRQVFNFFIWHE